MDWYDTIFELIDMRSFSNLWFWIVLAVMWSTASHWSMGVPYDLVVRARRVRGQVESDLLDLVRINTNRLLYIVEMSGTILFAFGCFAFTGLGDAWVLLRTGVCPGSISAAVSMMLVMCVNIFHARRLRRNEPDAGTRGKDTAAVPALHPDHRHDLGTGHRALGHVSEHFDRRSGIAQSERRGDEGSEPRYSRRRPRRV